MKNVYSVLFLLLINIAFAQDSVDVFKKKAVLIKTSIPYVLPWYKGPIKSFGPNVYFEKYMKGRSSWEVNFNYTRRHKNDWDIFSVRSINLEKSHDFKVGGSWNYYPLRSKEKAKRLTGFYLGPTIILKSYILRFDRLSEQSNWWLGPGLNCGYQNNYKRLYYGISMPVTYQYLFVNSERDLFQKYGYGTRKLMEYRINLIVGWNLSK